MRGAFHFLILLFFLVFGVFSDGQASRHRNRFASDGLEPIIVTDRYCDTEADPVFWGSDFYPERSRSEWIARGVNLRKVVVPVLVTEHVSEEDLKRLETAFQIWNAVIPFRFELWRGVRLRVDLSTANAWSDYFNADRFTEPAFSGDANAINVMITKWRNFLARVIANCDNPWGVSCPWPIMEPINADGVILAPPLIVITKDDYPVFDELASQTGDTRLRLPITGTCGWTDDYQRLLSIRCMDRSTILHEIGHFLGLRHAFHVPGGDDTVKKGWGYILEDGYSVMSYSHESLLTVNDLNQFHNEPKGEVYDPLVGSVDFCRWQQLYPGGARTKKDSVYWSERHEPLVWKLDYMLTDVLTWEEIANGAFDPDHGLVGDWICYFTPYWPFTAKVHVFKNGWETGPFQSDEPVIVYEVPWGDHPNVPRNAFEEMPDEAPDWISPWCFKYRPRDGAFAVVEINGTGEYGRTKNQVLLIDEFFSSDLSHVCRNLGGRMLELQSEGGLSVVAEKDRSIVCLIENKTWNQVKVAFFTEICNGDYNHLTALPEVCRAYQSDSGNGTENIGDTNVCSEITPLDDWEGYYASFCKAGELSCLQSQTPHVIELSGVAKLYGQSNERFLVEDLAIRPEEITVEFIPEPVKLNQPVEVDLSRATFIPTVKLPENWLNYLNTSLEQASSIDFYGTFVACTESGTCFWGTSSHLDTLWQNTCDQDSPETWEYVWDVRDNRVWLVLNGDLSPDWRLHIPVVSQPVDLQNVHGRFMIYLLVRPVIYAKTGETLFGPVFFASIELEL